MARDAERTAREAAGARAEETIDGSTQGTAMEAEKAQFELGKIAEAFRLDQPNTAEQMQGWWKVETTAVCEGESRRSRATAPELRLHEGSRGWRWLRPDLSSGKKSTIFCVTDLAPNRGAVCGMRWLDTGLRILGV
ncbi:unnamed protein product [Laminaria digitata]